MAVAIAVHARLFARLREQAGIDVVNVEVPACAGVPPGMMPRGTCDPINPSATSLIVPSPPNARIRSASAATASRARAAAVPAPGVGLAVT